MSGTDAYQRKVGNSQEVLDNEPPPPYPGAPPPYHVQESQYSVPVPQYSVQPPTILLENILNEEPARVICPNCKVNVITKIKFKTGSGTWLTSGLMCLAGLWLGCCLLPFCIKGAKDVIHSCPNCKTFIGRYKRI